LPDDAQLDRGRGDLRANAPGSVGQRLDECETRGGVDGGAKTLRDLLSVFVGERRRIGDASSNRIDIR
jgi:hypothetical protein